VQYVLIIIPFDIGGLQRAEYEKYCALRYDAMWFGSQYQRCVGTSCVSLPS